jgi:hypothetical protein
MNSDLNEKVSITLPKSAWLVLFELLAKSYDIWRKENPNDSAGAPMLIAANEFGERSALWHLEGAIESTLPEIFAGNYDELVEGAKALLAASN